MRPEEFYLRDIILASQSSESFVSEISQKLNIRNSLGPPNGDHQPPTTNVLDLA